MLAQARSVRPRIRTAGLRRLHAWRPLENHWRRAWFSIPEGGHLIDRMLTPLFSVRYRNLRFRCGFLMYFLILIFGSIPHARAEIGELASGLVLHSVAYAAITFLLATGSRRRGYGAALQAFLIVVFMGAIDELVQSFFPYRHAAVNDWLVDCAASFCTAIFFIVFIRNKFPPMLRQ